MLPKKNHDSAELDDALGRITDVLGEIAAEAGKYGVTLALENHGGLPCTGEEQVDVIRKVNSEHLRATVDIGNYMVCGQEAVEGATIAAPYAAYVHVKDMRKRKSSKTPWGWEHDSCVVGSGAVDVQGCLGALAGTGYDGYVAIEYEAREEESSGVPRSVEFVRQALAAIA